MKNKHVTKTTIHVEKQSSYYKISKTSGNN